LVVSPAGETALRAQPQHEQLPTRVMIQTSMNQNRVMTQTRALRLAMLRHVLFRALHATPEPSHDSLQFC
jgi:hypothetical protein